MSRRPIWFVALALVVCAPACEGSSAPSSDLPGSGLIAFVPADPHDVGISLLDPESGEVRRLTTEIRNVSDLAWSPDGSRLTFVPDRRRGIGIIDADGGGLRTLTDPEAFPKKTTFSQATWSPDGERVAFAAGGVPPNAECSGLDCLLLVRARIYVMELETAEVTQLTDDDLLASSPTWSPDGARIAFVAIPASELSLEDAPESPQIYVVDAGGGPAHSITSFDLSPSQLAWSPDGESIAFVTVSSDIQVIGPGGGPAKLTISSLVATEGSFENSDPAWSPDGRRLLFTRLGVEGFTFWVAEADGTGQRQLHSGCCASWQPVPAA
jgi:Tol biopolymer transport system component